MPVVSTRIGGIPDVITDGETGFFVILGTSLLTFALRRLILDEDLRRRMGEAAVARVNLFDADKIVARYEKVLLTTNHVVDFSEE